MANGQWFGIPGKGPVASGSIGLMGLLLIIAIIFGIESACSDPSYSLDNNNAPSTLEQYCDQYPELCGTPTAE